MAKIIVICGFFIIVYYFFRGIFSLIYSLYRRFFEKPKEKVQKAHSLDQKLLALSKVDFLTWRQLHEAVICFGEQGSGKTSGVLFRFLKIYGKYGFGGLLLASKPTDVKDYKTLLLRSGRKEEDIIVISADGDYCYDLFGDVFGQDDAYTVSMVAFLGRVMEVSMGKSESSDTFWITQSIMLLTHTINLLKYGDSHISIDSIYRTVISAPSLAREDLEEDKKEVFMQSYFYRVAECGWDNGGAEDPAFVDSFYWFCNSFYNMATETRSGIEANLIGSFLYIFQQNPLRKLFGKIEGKTFSLKDCYRKNKIVIIDITFLEHGKVGLIAGSIFKMAFQAIVQKKDRLNYPGNLFLVSDEAQLLYNSYDTEFLQTARSSRTSSLFLLQNIQNLFFRVGKSNEAAVKSLMGLFAYKFFCCNSCEETNRMAAELCGQSLQERVGVNVSGGKNRDGGVSTNQQVDYREGTRPSDFIGLKKGGPPSWMTEVMVIKTGEPFNATGFRHMKVRFPQILL